jgi:hypothetical protein
VLWIRIRIRIGSDLHHFADPNPADPNPADPDPYQV